MKKKVVIFGGGTGLSGLLTGLKDFPVDITAVITVSDNGRSTGKLREEFYMPAVGDIRKVITSLSNVKDDIKDLLSYRFDTYSDLDGHPIGNLIMVGMYNITGSLKKSIDSLSNFLDVESTILPLSEDYLTLMGEDVNGEIVEGEAEITAKSTKYKRLFYKEEPKVLDEVIQAINDADLIIFSIGSLFTSIIPHILCKDVIKAIDNSNAKILYTCNAVTQPGETDNYKVSDHVKLINSYLGERKLDCVIASNTKIPKDIVKKYETKEQKDLVIVDHKNINCNCITDDLLILDDDKIRHDSLKLAKVIFNYLMEI